MNDVARTPEPDVLTKAKPFVKFVGGKRQLIPQILPLLPKRMRAYREPFVGGGAVFYELANMTPLPYETAFINDKNDELINAYEVISNAESLANLLVALGEMTQKNSPEYFEKMRQLRTDDHELRAARFIYLNKTCFNGLYRVNQKGEFNAPWGKYKSPNIRDVDNLEACWRVLQGVIVTSDDFEESLEFTREGDAVYFDPPYIPLTKTSSFTAYDSDGFTVVDHVRLARVFRALVERGVHVVLSNSDTPLTRELYRGFEIHQVQAARAINSKADKRGAVSEILVVGRKI